MLCVGDKMYRVSAWGSINIVTDLKGSARESRTLFPTTKLSPSGAQASVKASPNPLTSLMMALVRTSQNLTVPSLPTEHSSSSLTGLKATFSTAAEWPLSSVDCRTLGLSTFPELSLARKKLWDEPSSTRHWLTYTHVVSCLYTQSRPMYLADSMLLSVDYFRSASSQDLSCQ